MQNLIKVQKACHVFKVLVTIAMVVCFIAAAATISAFVSMYAFNSNVIFQMVAEELPDVSREETLAGILSMFFEALADAILLVIARSYLVFELREKTPFTAKGADKMRSLGIICIVMPVVASILSAVVYTYYGFESSSYETENTGIIIGIVLIVLSFVLRYGADLEQYVRSISAPAASQPAAPKPAEPKPEEQEPNTWNAE